MNPFIVNNRRNGRNNNLGLVDSSKWKRVNIWDIVFIGEDKIFPSLTMIAKEVFPLAFDSDQASIIAECIKSFTEKYEDL